MGKTYDFLTPDLQAWIAAQQMFFVATAPSADSGHVNCSPKGTNSFRVLGPRDVAYLDLTGSGIETIAHVKENRRIVIMFCAFAGPPKILRLHGRGAVVEPDDVRFASLAAHFPPSRATRAIVHVTITRIGDACGHGVPLYEFQGHRDLIERWAENRGPDGMNEYRCQKNATSLDGLPGLRKF